MCLCILLETADVTVGRADKASLSQQALLELVIQEITNKQVIWGGKDKPEIIKRWDGLTMEDDKVTKIDWYSLDLHGSVHLEWLPLTVTNFRAQRDKLTGTIDLSDLPHAIKTLDLSENEFCGSIDLRELPAELENLNLSYNRLNGSVDFTALPGKLRTLVLNHNLFNGSVNLNNLPPRMEEMYLHENLFSGIILTSRLPGSFEHLVLHGNPLSGELFLDAAQLKEIDVQGTNLIKRWFEDAPPSDNHVPRRWQTSLLDQFYASISQKGKMKISGGNPSHDYCVWDGVTCDAGIVSRVAYGGKRYGNFDVHSLPPPVKVMSFYNSRQRYTIDTRKFPRELQECSLEFNHLYGSVDLRTLPNKLEYLNFRHNELTGPIDLTSLPPTLEKLYLDRNTIVQPVVYYDKLPPKAKEIQLVYDHREGSNHIGKVCAVHVEMAVENKAFFKGMSKRKVR